MQYLTQAYFNSSYPTSITGEDISILISRLKQITQIIGISQKELFRLHKTSNLRQFLLMLSDKAGIDVNAPLENRIRFGTIVAGAIEKNQQNIIQDYINLVLKSRQNKK